MSWENTRCPVCGGSGKHYFTPIFGGPQESSDCKHCYKGHTLTRELREPCENNPPLHPSSENNY